MTLGEYRVGISFNPSGNELVTNIKRWAADLIDLCEEHRAKETHGEIIRLWAHAQTLLEDAAMNAVKAATKQPYSD
jgi:hypothetical protein